ncbi:nuclease domain-containing protein [Alloalcanivorax xenomutans]
MSEITDSAGGAACELRLPGHCNWNPETTVACHLRLPGVAGTALKPSDLLTVRGCSACHDVIDGRAMTDISRGELDRFILEAFCRTLLAYEREGLIEAVE